MNSKIFIDDFILILLIFIIGCSIFIPSLIQFRNGYEAGFTSFDDTYVSVDDFLVGKLRDCEGFYDYYLGEYFWYQQGYEEGYKRRAHQYVDEYKNTKNTD